MGEENIFLLRTHISCSLVNHSHKGPKRRPLSRSEWHDPLRILIWNLRSPGFSPDDQWNELSRR